MKRGTQVRSTKVNRGPPPEIKSKFSSEKKDTPKITQDEGAVIPKEKIQKENSKNDTLMNLEFIRCSCRKVFDSKYRKIRVENEELIKERVKLLIDKGYSETQAMDFLYENNLDMKHVMDKLNLNRICCRRTFLSDIIIPFPRPDFEVAARLKKIIPELIEVEKNYLSELPENTRNKIIANSHKLNLPEPSDFDPKTELYTEKLTEEDIDKNYKTKKGFNFVGFEYVGEGMYIQVLGASELDNGVRLRTYLGR